MLVDLTIDSDPEEQPRLVSRLPFISEYHNNQELIGLSCSLDDGSIPNPLIKSLGRQTLAHRTLSPSPHTKNSTIPFKRKSDADSAESGSESSYASAVAYPQKAKTRTTNVSSRNPVGHDSLSGPFKRVGAGPGTGAARQARQIPASAPSLASSSGTDSAAGHYAPSPAPETLRVVIPSPSVQLKKEIDSAERLPDAEVKTPEITGMSEKYYPTDALERRAMRGAYPAARKTNRAGVPLVIGTPGPFLTEKNRRPVIDLLCKNLQKKLASIKGPAVTVAKADEKRLAKATTGFEFINEYKLREGVAPISKEFQSGCSCETICLPDRCQCLAQEEDSEERIIAYKRARDNPRFMVLRPEFMKRTSMIFECNSLCGCEEKCWNRVVQLGRTIRLEIFHTGARGFGLRSLDTIRAGQFIDLYLGEVITTSKADQREKIANTRNAPSYLFSLDFLVDDESSYVVDGANYGAATRFINHSCNPNCRMFPVSRTHGDDYLYDLAFFALREIKPGTELTFDYNPGMERVDKLDPNAVPCLCGEPNCRGQLWATERKKAR
ncbi:protein clrD [Aspergillus nidulans FGSC A4]|uniref:Histone-lysine N-methyltransferase Clr4 (AFU_orthologue AFUA_1G11090) n=1 Tax=Emericella nidulans (strain FGSC A4 / ATCC 38163 / CBS 112.46 / NRRL 194 / M139) TaxID=227321 RepID=C8VT24_EMENI|nr:protein clrD [Aspergillus nidulans FGSC A4]CBF88005.1 TPA: histone-lysine N-methyltransferase Clr4 (AFU_orthologue; AFUA_1G11090) [Aspergillus nidulans FGSC A4]